MMKIILSRKGFDSENGKQPSPILPNGDLLSLPIPSKNDCIRYNQLIYDKKTYYYIIQQLKPTTKIKEHYYCHLDPDIRENCIKRESNWKGLFGQQGSAQGHLQNNNIGIGDLFLFFGWFKQTEYKNGILCYVHDAPDLHIIFGYLQVGNMILIKDEIPLFAQLHPHANKFEQKNNCIYVASEKLFCNSSKKGYGTLCYKNERILTKTGCLKSHWDLPNIFKDVNITYHSKNSFKNEGYFDSAKKGQEFIVYANQQIIDYVITSIL